MRKVKLSVISVILVLSMILVVNAVDDIIIEPLASPDDIQPFGDPYFTAYSVSIAPRTNKGEVAVSCTIYATDTAQKIGIVIVDVIDADTGEIIKTLEDHYWENDYMYTHSFAAQGKSGHRYYARATYIVQFSNNSAGSKTINSGLTTAP